MALLNVNLNNASYKITVQSGAIKKAKEIFDLNRKVLIVTDSGVPKIYSETVAKVCLKSVTVTLSAGESSKSPENYLLLLKALSDNGFSRSDCVVAVGGGMVGDISGFAAATYMRGIDFYNIPTTLISQIDSSVGGKTAVNFGGYKNLVGAFYQPKAVLVDPELLKTLDKRNFSSGIAECIKIFAVCDKNAFSLLESPSPDYEKITELAIKDKISVVSKDEKDYGIRKILNFGHTVGHALESIGMESGVPLLHGEGVAIGMLCMSEGDAQKQIHSLIEKYGLPDTFKCKKSDFSKKIHHDKKSNGEKITEIRVSQIGEYEFTEISPCEAEEFAKGIIEFI